MIKKYQQLHGFLSDTAIALFARRLNEKCLIMRYQNSLFAVLSAALATVAFFWYRTAQQLEAYQQYQQDLAPMFSLCERFVTAYSDDVFHQSRLDYEAYRTGTGSKYRHRYQRIDDLCEQSMGLCDSIDIAVLPTLIRTYADSVQLYTDEDTDVVQMAHNLLKDNSYPNTPDTLLRKKIRLQLMLLRAAGNWALIKRTASCDGVILDMNTLILVPKQLEATAGQPFEANVCLARYKPTLFQELAYINDKPCRLIAGSGYFKTVFSTPGIHTLTLKAESTNPLRAGRLIWLRTVDINVKP